MIDNAFLNGAAYIKGRYMPFAEATIPVTDWGFTRSDVVYDVVHVWQHRFFRLEARLRDEVKRLRAVELAVKDDPMATQSAIEDASASWPKPKGRAAGSKGGKPGTRTWRGKGR